MSTPPPGAPVPARAERSLFAGLLHDAAVFPPARTPLPRAVQEHLRRAHQGYGDLLGPLLVPASAVGEVVALPRSGPLSVGLIARPGVPLQDVERALGLLRGVPDLEVAGVEVAHGPGWGRALGWGLPLSVEVDRAADLSRTLEELVAARPEAVGLQAKLRTQSTEAQPLPTPLELAGFIGGCVGAGMPFKLTGGLHHAVAHTSRGGEDEHGVLNVLAATDRAVRGAATAELAELLVLREVAALTDIVTTLGQVEVSAVRACFTAYGCCGVMDPVGELVGLGLIDPAPGSHQP